ncbi:MAG: M16 family metallopeptidase [Phycisphaerales bacterium]
MPFAHAHTTSSSLIDRRLANGMRVLIDPISSMRSAAVSLALPVGSAGDPAERIGESAMLEEFLARGAGGMSSREHSDALDRAGASRSSNVGAHFLGISATCIGLRLAETLNLLSMCITSPAHQESDLPAARSLCLATLDALPDDPGHFVALALAERVHPAPFNRHGYGEREAIESITMEQLRIAWRDRCRPATAMIGLAGAVDPDAVIPQLEELFAGWEGETQEPKQLREAERGVVHIEAPTAQVHIVFSCPAPRAADADCMLERLATQVLSGGMSGRLFTEVRERRSLCYSVGASYSAGRDEGTLTISAGTTPERAQETLDVCMAEVQRMKLGVQPQEFHRAVVGLKSRLVMQGESTAARAAALCRDAFRLGHARTLTEITDEIDSISLEALNAYCARRNFGPFTTCALGPVALVPPG